MSVTAAPGKGITEDEVQRPAFLVRTLLGILVEIARLKRRFIPRRVFVDLDLDGEGSVKYRVQHDFGTLPHVYVTRWWGSAAPVVQIHVDSDARTVVFVSYVAGRATICVEEPAP